VRSVPAGPEAEHRVVRQQGVQIAKRLRPLVQSGEVTFSVRIWKQPRVKVGGRYSLPPGEIEVSEESHTLRSLNAWRSAQASPTSKSFSESLNMATVNSCFSLSLSTTSTRS